MYNVLGHGVGPTNVNTGRKGRCFRPGFLMASKTMFEARDNPTLMSFLSLSLIDRVQGHKRIFQPSLITV
jgi:hypothetical protein